MHCICRCLAGYYYKHHWTFYDLHNTQWTWKKCSVWIHCSLCYLLQSRSKCGTMAIFQLVTIHKRLHHIYYIRSLSIKHCEFYCNFTAMYCDSVNCMCLLRLVDCLLYNMCVVTWLQSQMIHKDSLSYTVVKRHKMIHVLIKQTLK